MAVRWLAWLDFVGLVLVAWLSAKHTRASMAVMDQVSRASSVLAVGLCFIGACLLLARRSPAAAKILLATPPVVVAAFLLGLMGAALVGSLEA